MSDGAGTRTLEEAMAARRQKTVDVADLLRMDDDGGACHPAARDSDGVMAGEDVEPARRRARVERMIEEFHAARQRRQRRRAMRLWRQAEVDLHFARIEAPAERIH